MKRISFLIIFILIHLTSVSQVIIDTLPYPFSLSPVARKSPACMMTDLNNNIWVGTTRQGIIKFNGSTWQFYDRSNSGILSDSIVCIHPDSNNAYYGTFKGIGKFDGANWSFWNRVNDGICSDTIRCIETFNNKIFVGTYNGISIYYGNSWTNINSANSALGCDTVNYILHTPGDTIWIATENGLFGLFNNTIFSQNISGPFSVNNAVHNLLYDNYGNLWIENFDISDPVEGYNVRILRGNRVNSIRTLFPLTIHFPSAFRICGQLNGFVYGFSIMPLNYFIKIIKIDPQNWSYQLSPIGYSNLSTWPSEINSNYLNNSRGVDFGFDQTGKMLMLSEGIPAFYQSPLYTVNASQMQNDTIDDVLDINNLHLTYNPNNLFFHDGWEGGKISYAGMPEASITYGSNIWISAFDSTVQNLYVARSDIEQGSDYVPGPIDTVNQVSDTTTQLQYNKVWKLNQSTIDYFKYQYSIGNVTNGSYSIPSEIMTWPANGSANESKQLAPYVDSNSDQYYNPYDGDYPVIHGSQELFTITNCIDTSWGLGHFGIELHTSVYGYNCPDNLSIDSLLHNTAFVHFEIFNRSNKAFYQMRFGINNISNLGDAMDDYVGFNVDRNYYYNYNSDNDDLGLQGFQQNPPIFNCILLKGPEAAPNDLTDNNRNGIVDEPNETVASSSFMVYRDDFSTQGNPTSAADFKNYLSHTWRDGSPLKYGGTGYYSGTDSCRFMYSDNSDSSWYNSYGVNEGFPWSENSPLPAGNPNQPGIRRSVFSMGPFTMLPHTSKTIDIAFMLSWNKTLPNGVNTSVLLNNLMVDSLNAMWAANSFPCTDITSRIDEKKIQTDVVISPNPATGLIKLKSPVSFTSWILINNNGESVRSGKQLTTNSVIDLSNVGPGVYFLKLINQSEVVIKIIVRM